MNFQHEALDVLSKCGADMNTPNLKGQTPLELALRQTPRTEEEQIKRFQTIRTLAKNGADLNIHNEYGQTPLITMASRHDKKSIDLLLELGADATLKNKDGKTYQDIYNNTVLVAQRKISSFDK